MAGILDPITISRDFYNGYYILILVLSALALLIARRERLWRFSLALWLTSGTICLVWETALYLVGSRHYNFFAPAEVLYHAFTEAGPGLIITIVLASRLGIIDIERFREGK